jgi:hypothetical protein
MKCHVYLNKRKILACIQWFLHWSYPGESGYWGNSLASTTLSYCSFLQRARLSYRRTIEEWQINIYSFCMCYEITYRMCLLEILNFSLSYVEEKTRLFARCGCGIELFGNILMRRSSAPESMSASLSLCLTKWASSQLSPGGGNIFQGDIKAGMSKGHARHTSSRNAICQGAFPTHSPTFLFVLSPYSASRKISNNWSNF